MTEIGTKKKFIISVPAADTQQTRYYEAVNADGFYRQEAFLFFYVADQKAEGEVRIVSIFKHWDYVYEEGIVE